MPTWPAGWTASTPPAVDFALVRAAAATGRQDLGLTAATGGLMQAARWRGADLGTALDAAPTLFQFLYVLGGRITLADGAVLGRGDVLAQGMGPAPRLAAAAATDVLHVVMPGDSGGVTGRAVLHDGPGAFVAGAGPRRYFAYRDLATAPLTGRRIHIHVVQSLGAMPGGTGWHHHSMGQWFMVLRGWADLEVEGRGLTRMVPGDAMCLGAGMKHNVPAYADDYLVLEMCLPADYETVAAPAPPA